jgi:hypothetical protein
VLLSTFSLYYYYLCLIFTQAKTTSIEHPYMSKEDRLEAGRARLRIAKEVSDDFLAQAVVYDSEANLIMLILSAHTGLFPPIAHLPHGCSGWSTSDQPLNYSKWRSPIATASRHLSGILRDHRSNTHPFPDHQPTTPSASSQFSSIRDHL